MATITLRPEIYNKAVLFAKKDRVDVDEWVNKVLLKMVLESSAEDELKTAEQKMFSWDELGGIFASDKNDKELLDEYLEDKYGL